jgi:hypothetical protein
MVKHASLVLAIGLMAVPLVVRAARPGQLQGLPRPCLHGPSEQATDRARREQAVKLAGQINRAEAAAPGVFGSPKAYRPLDQLPNIAPTPAGFRLRFYTDGHTYLFSLKDTLDSCEYAIFSDQDEGVYEATPRTGVQVVPVEVP